MEIGVFLIFSLKNTYIPDATIIIIPIKTLKLITSPNTNHPKEIDHKINIYSNGAIVGGDEMRYARWRQKNPPAPANPIINKNIVFSFRLKCHSLNKNCNAGSLYLLKLPSPINKEIKLLNIKAEM